MQCRGRWLPGATTGLIPSRPDRSRAPHLVLGRAGPHHPSRMCSAEDNSMHLSCGYVRPTAGPDRFSVLYHSTCLITDEVISVCSLFTWGADCQILQHNTLARTNISLMTHCLRQTIQQTVQHLPACTSPCQTSHKLHNNMRCLARRSNK